VCLPRPVTHYRVPGAIPVEKMQFQNHLRLAETAGELGVTSALSLDVVHSIAHQNSNRVRARVHSACNVIRVVQNRLPVIRPTGIEHCVRHIVAVQHKLILAQARDHDNRAFNGLVYLEIAAEKRHPCGLVFCVHQVLARLWLAGGVRCSCDPLRCPFPGAHGAGHQCRDLTPLRRPSSLVPDLNSPIVTGMRLKRLTRVSYAVRLRGFNPSGVPRIRRAGLKSVQRSGKLYSISRLIDIALSGADSREGPVKARMVSIDACRIRLSSNGDRRQTKGRSSVGRKYVSSRQTEE
jgi:hypothetical protein